MSLPIDARMDSATLAAAVEGPVRTPVAMALPALSTRVSPVAVACPSVEPQLASIETIETLEIGVGATPYDTVPHRPLQQLAYLVHHAHSGSVPLCTT